MMRFSVVSVVRNLMLLLIFLFTGVQAVAQVNTLNGFEVLRDGEKVILKIVMKNTVSIMPSSFSTSIPPRIIFDFPDVSNATGMTKKILEVGALRALDIVQAAGKTRVVLNLKHALPFAVQSKDRELIVTLVAAGASQKAEANLALESGKIAAEKNAILDIDFRGGANGVGRIIVDLSRAQLAVDVRQQGQIIVIDFLKTSLPDMLRRRLDVKDFGTPVQAITTSAQGDMVRMQIEPRGQWEHLAWQTDRRLVVEVRPLKQDSAQPGTASRGFKGEKLSLNFQSIDVRALLQVIADFTGMNVVASDTVTGNLTLRLKDVPWDQALDIVMQARGLDMRKNGNVMWIAPKDELLTKERLELEQRAQIAELEPLITETFQLNYQKADAFRQVFGLDGQVARGSILSRRGSASAEPRTNKLFVTDTPTRLDEVRKLIQLTDVPTRQVMIEARIVEADDKFSKNLGAKLGFLDLRSPPGVGLPLGGRAAVTGNLLGVGEQTRQAAVTGGSFIPNTQFVNLPAASIKGTAPASMAISLFSASANRFLNLELSALEAESKNKIISSPRVITADQQPAIIEQGEEIPYQQATSSGATSVQFKKANLKLEVTPQITPDGNIILTVDVAKDSRGEPAGGNFAINTKHVKTSVQVENGGTVVLGGIFSQNEINTTNKVPFFGDLPVLGHLFRNTSRVNDRSELLIFITPRVISETAAGRTNR